MTENEKNINPILEELEKKICSANCSMGHQNQCVNVLSQKHQKFVCLSDSLRKQSTIGTQGAIEQKMLLFIILHK